MHWYGITIRKRQFTWWKTECVALAVLSILNLLCINEA